jgi:outer membrane protein assembly factor BamB
MRFALLSLLIASSLAVPARADWPQFRGPTGLGYTTAKNLPVEWGGPEKKNVLWSAPLKGEGHASPIVAGDKVIVCNVGWPVKSDKEMPKHFVTAYSLRDGSELWSTEIEPGPWLRSDFRSGPGGGYAAPTPCLAKDHIHCLFGSAVLAILDLDGKLVKRQEIKPHTFDVTIGSSLITNGEDLFLLCGMAKKEDSRLACLAAVTAELKWEKKLPTVGFAHSTPVLIEAEGQRQLVIAASGGGETDDAVQSFDPATGERLWQARGAGEASSPAYAEGLLYFDSGRGSKGTVVDVSGAGDVTSTHIKWSVGAVPEAIGSPIIVDKRVYRLHTPNILKCWRLEDGEQVFSQRLNDISSTWGSPLADARGRIYFATAGKSYVLQSGDKFESLAVNDLGDANHASPAVAGDDKLLLLGQKKLWCVGRR